MTERAFAGGAYPAERAAALAGVPKSTLHYWARTKLVVPSVSSSRQKRWSYADLLELRLINWLRQEKPPDLRISSTSLHQIRRTLASVEQLGERLQERSLEVYVDHRGRLIFEGAGEEGLHIPLAKDVAQGLVDTKVDLMRPFEARGLKGPDLVQPRPALRILPGKLSGEPHVEETRIPTQTLMGLSRRGLAPSQIIELYPPLSLESVEQALELEVQLEHNLRVAA